MFYSFIRVQFLWIVFAIFFLGLIYRKYSIIKLSGKKDKVFYDHYQSSWAFKSVITWLFPFASKSMREHPFSTLILYAFHLCLLICPIFLTAHSVILDQSWGISLPTLPETWADNLTVAFLFLAGLILLRRILLPEVRIVTTSYDVLLWVIVVMPFLTGYLCRIQAFDPENMMILHIVSAGMMLMVLPFTKLSHAVFFFFTRIFIGSEFGRREAKTW